jgi:hypothetical protein
MHFGPSNLMNRSKRLAWTVERRRAAYGFLPPGSSGLFVTGFWRPIAPAELLM